MAPGRGPPEARAGGVRRGPPGGKAAPRLRDLDAPGRVGREMVHVPLLLLRELRLRHRSWRGGRAEQGA
eukprot:15473053-Alexandrium_andersonii.AAC.1